MSVICFYFCMKYGSAQLNLTMNAQYLFRVACRNLHGISLYR